MKTKKKFIALCDRLDQLTSSRSNNFLRNPEISVEIAVLSRGEDGEPITPRNWRRDFDEPRNSAGGCSARLFGTTSGVGEDMTPSVLFADYGPEIRYGCRSDYEHGLKACNVVRRGLSRQYAASGPTDDAGELLRRWLLACGLKGKCVWMRPESHHKKGWGGDWLNKGEWVTLTIDEFVERVRAKFPQEVTA
jgi:hypothetical protein